MIFDIIDYFCYLLKPLRRFWKPVYYAITNFLIVLGAAALLFAVWYFSFGKRL